MNSVDSLELVVNEVNIGTLKRRKLRNLIFRLRTGRAFDQYDKERVLGVKLIFEPQFKKVVVDAKNGIEDTMTWANFTFLWDLHPRFPLKIITSKEWVHAGGGYDKHGFCIPTAFTRQKM